MRIRTIGDPIAEWHRFLSKIILSGWDFSLSVDELFSVGLSHPAGLKIFSMFFWFRWIGWPHDRWHPLSYQMSLISEWNIIILVVTGIFPNCWVSNYKNIILMFPDVHRTPKRFTLWLDNISELLSTPETPRPIIQESLFFSICEISLLTLATWYQSADGIVGVVGCKKLFFSA